VSKRNRNGAFFTRSATGACHPSAARACLGRVSSFGGIRWRKGKHTREHPGTANGAASLWAQFRASVGAGAGTAWWLLPPRRCCYRCGIRRCYKVQRREPRRGRRGFLSRYLAAGFMIIALRVAGRDEQQFIAGAAGPVITLASLVADVRVNRKPPYTAPVSGELHQRFTVAAPAR
jgi:hypothetical protein